jgi:hypothetical protein
VVSSVIPARLTSSVTSAIGSCRVPVHLYWPNAGDPLTEVDISRAFSQVPSEWASTTAMCSRPRSHQTNGGIDDVASSCSRAVSAATS